ncbi:hypothetical protein FHR33_007560 [Nonomuraea dietziae]|uniref:Uncharacterized protein n=1 Tax=Nonomuraea dietziae TaxID=65515 RepID=A0A7W5VGQ6_9ACTN|nr:hypothetical protein [Nonomuraea dietziae]
MNDQIGTFLDAAEEVAQAELRASLGSKKYPT